MTAAILRAGFAGAQSASAWDQNPQSLTAEISAHGGEHRARLIEISRDAATRKAARASAKMSWTLDIGEGQIRMVGTDAPTLMLTSGGEVVMIVDGRQKKLDINITPTLAVLKNGSDSFTEEYASDDQTIRAVINGKTLTGGRNREALLECDGMVMTLETSGMSLVAGGRLTPENRTVAVYMAAVFLKLINSGPIP